MAPEFVLEYIVAHETVHLKIPDHSKRFWLTLQSICPKMDFARQWLVANSERLNVKLDRLCRPHKDSLSAGTTIKNGKR
jgi:predicted metal-dependent hydrolase